MKTRTENSAVLYATAEIKTFSGADLVELKLLALAEPKGVCRICMHHSPEALMHEMIIAKRKDAAYPAHCHPDSEESCQALDGLATMVFYHDDGMVKEKIALGPTGSGRASYVRIPPGLTHDLEIETEYFIFLETKLGPFRPSDNRPAPFLKKERNPISWWRVDFMDEAAEAAREAVKNRHMTMGPLTRQFEQRVAEMLNVAHVVATSSGSAALSLALIEAGIGPGDQVIVPGRSWIATAHAPFLLGAEVVFADIEENRPVMNPAAFEAALTDRTKAVIAVHLNGWPADLARIREIAEAYGIIVIEDACQAFLSASNEGGWLGCHSRAGCFSLSIGKMISSGQGGFVVTNDDAIARRLSMLRTQGVSDVTMAKWELAGGNFRFWDLPAAVALTQLDRSEEKAARVKAVYKFYEQALQGHPLVEVVKRDLSTGQLPLYVDCFCPRKVELLGYLSENGIQARPYYENMNKAPHFAAKGADGLPNSDRYEKEGLILPCGPDRTIDELEYVAEALHRFGH